MSGGARHLGTTLQEGVTKKNIITYYISAMFTIMMAVLLNTLQPYVLTTFLGVDPLEQGDIAGTSSMVGELVLVPMVFIWGVISDKIGRRSVYVLGFIFEGLGYAIIPAMGTVEGYYFARCVWAVGSAGTTGMLATILGDYVIDEDRGKATGIMGFMNAIGASIAAVGLSKLPGLFEGLGIKSDDGLAQGWAAYLTTAAICGVAAIILQFGLAGKETEKESDEDAPLKEVILKGTEYARNDKYIILAYVTAFVARADLAMAGVFIPQWNSSYLQEITARAAINDHEVQCKQAAVQDIGVSPYAADMFFGEFSDGIYFNATEEAYLSHECDKVEHPADENSFGYTGYFVWYDQSPYCCADARQCFEVDENDAPIGRIEDPAVYIDECKYGFSCCTCEPDVGHEDPSHNWKYCELTKELQVRLVTVGIENGGTMIAILGVGGMLAAPFFGILTDKIDRLSAVTIALSMNMVGYGLSGAVSDPAAGVAFLMAFVIGAGEVAGVISTQVLVQSRAEDLDCKGSVIGMFNLFGGVGILINSKVGGSLFKTWMYAGPFLWICILNVIVGGVCFLMIPGYKKQVAVEKANKGGDVEEKVAKEDAAVAPMNGVDAPIVPTMPKI